MGAVTEKIVDDLRTALYLGRERTPTQDIRFQFQQLTDVVVRALSPGINDPFTANSGIAEITIGLLELCKHDTRPRQLRARDGVVRVIAPAATVADVLEETVGHIVIYAASDRFVMDALRRLVDAVETKLAAGERAETATIARLRRTFDDPAASKSR